MAELQTLCELSNDAGLAGKILRNLPRRLLLIADQQSDPWLFLSKQFATTNKQQKDYLKLFEAGSSQRQAILRLLEIARDGGSVLTTTWRLKMRAAQELGDERVAMKAARKIVGSFCRSERGRRFLLQDAPPEIRAMSKGIYEELYSKDIRKLGRKKADEKWKGDYRIASFDHETSSDKIADELAAMIRALNPPTTTIINKNETTIY